MVVLKKQIKELLIKNRSIYKFLQFLIIKKKEFFLKRKNKKKKLVNITEDLNFYIVDTRISTFRWDSVMGLIRASNFFYNKKWSIIIFEDASLRYHEKEISLEIYTNNLINIFFQSILILSNPPTSIKIINNNDELKKIIKISKKIFPENFSLLGATTGTKWYKIENFEDKDFENFKINQPILRASKYHSKIFKNYLDYRNIKEFITITIRNKHWEKTNWNTDIKDMKLYLDYIKKNNLENHDVLILPDTEEDISKEIINFVEDNKLRYHIFYHGSFSIPLRFLAYSKSNFNFSSTNGPPILLFFIKNNSYIILKDPINGDIVQNFVKKLDKNIFLKRKFKFYEKYIQKAKS